MTTPIAINIATLLQAPVSLALLIVILSGVIGGCISPFILRHINDERASGLALGLRPMPLEQRRHGNEEALLVAIRPLVWLLMQYSLQFQVPSFILMLQKI